MQVQVLVIGATGLIGSAIVARLIGTGCRVVGIARRTAAAAQSFPSAQWIMVDIAAMNRPEAWLPNLTGIDAVVNCAGVLQDSPYESTRLVHVAAIDALFAACERTARVRRVVHFSAIRIDREAPTPFSQSKIEGDRALMSRKLDWVILRPSVVVGSAAYGGSALFRGLAALPLLSVMPDTGLLQPVQLDDVVETVLLCLGSTIPPCIVLELAGPDQLSLVEILAPTLDARRGPPIADCTGAPLSCWCRIAAAGRRWRAGRRVRDCGRAGGYCDRCRHRSATHCARCALCCNQRFGLLSHRGDGQ